MREKDIVRFLVEVKKLIKVGNIRYTRSNQIDDFNVLGIKDFDDANQHILSLNVYQFRYDEKPFYFGGSQAFFFNKIINHKFAYIKLKIEEIESNDIVLCISFHESRRKK